MTYLNWTNENGVSFKKQALKTGVMGTVFGLVSG